MLPKIGYLTIEQEEKQQGLPRGKSFLFDFNQGDFVLKDGKLIPAEGEEALKIWIEKVLRTDKGKYPIYSTEYGVSLEDLIIGHNLPLEFIKSEVKREVTETLMTHPDITSISDWKLEKSSSRLMISFQVNDSISQEVIFNV